MVNPYSIKEFCAVSYTLKPKLKHLTIIIQPAVRMQSPICHFFIKLIRRSARAFFDIKQIPQCPYLGTVRSRIYRQIPDNPFSALPRSLPYLLPMLEIPPLQPLIKGNFFFMFTGKFFQSLRISVLVFIRPLPPGFCLKMIAQRMEKGIIPYPVFIFF